MWGEIAANNPEDDWKRRMGEVAKAWAQYRLG